MRDCNPAPPPAGLGNELREMRVVISNGSSDSGRRRLPTARPVFLRILFIGKVRLCSVNNKLVSLITWGFARYHSVFLFAQSIISPHAQESIAHKSDQFAVVR